MFVAWLLWVTACPPPGVFGTLLYEKRGNVSVAGVFGRRSGEECSGEVERGLEEMISAMWTIEALNAYEYLAGVTIGLSAFDVCEPSDDQTTDLGNVTEDLSRFDRDPLSIGIVTTAEMRGKLKASGRISTSRIFGIRHIVSGDMLSDMTVQVLSNLQWRNVSIGVFDSVTGRESFRGRASAEGVSIGEDVVMNCSKSCPPPLGNFPEEAEASPVAVVIASFANIGRLLEKFRNRDMKLILTPTDFVFDFGLSDLPEDTIVVLPSMQDPRTSSEHLNNILRRKDFFTPRPPVRGPLFLGTAATILGLLKPFRAALEENCTNHRPCAPLTDLIREINANKTPETMQISTGDVEEALQVLKIEPDTNDEMFLCVASAMKANASEDVAIFQVLNLRSRTFEAVAIMIKDDLVRRGGGRTTSHRRKEALAGLLQEQEGEVERGCDPRGVQCGNSSGKPSAAGSGGNGGNGTVGEEAEVRWGYVTWVSVNTCVCLVGVTCTVSMMVFVTAKICRNGLRRGSPYFTVLLMVWVVVTYLSSLPFEAELGEEFMCGYRKCVPPVVFAVLLSLLLSRGVMVALREAGGELSGHANGCLQFILSVFMIGVQASITVRNWSLSKSLYDLTCGDVHDKHDVILALVYDFLLLILLACVSPFIVRSNRNYKEGLLFSISVFFITIAWSAWISFYLFLPDDHKDPALALGLNSTASVLLLCLFIPQMYLMAAPSSPHQTILPSHPQPDFHSNLALHDSAFGTYRHSHPTSPKAPASPHTPETPHPTTTVSRQGFHGQP